MKGEEWNEEGRGNGVWNLVRRGGGGNLEKGITILGQMEEC